MKKRLITTTIFILVMSICLHAQKKPNFNFDQKTMIDLGMSAEQQQKIKDVRSKFAAEFNVIALEAKAYAAAGEKRMDSVMTDAQKQKAADMKASIIEYNKAH